MPHAKQMLESHPWPGHIDRQVLADLIEAAAECAQTCTSCADACLSEEGVADLRKCIRIDLDCADVCAATTPVLTRETEYDAPLSKALVEACRQACATCAEECERHAEHHEHCRICAEACRRCEQACREFLEAA